jgi:hypothetical protein
LSEEQEIRYNSNGTKTLLIGPPGTGKTTSLVTFIEAGLDLFAIGTDPGFEEVILDAIRERNLPLDKFHYRYIAPASVDWDVMITQGRNISQFGYESLSTMKSGPGINVMAIDLILGGKVTAHQGEWGVAMAAEEKLILKLCGDLKCFFVLTAHIEKEPDIVSGVPITMVGALGKKLAPKLPRTFSDVILAQKEGDKFTWSTAAVNVDLKSRSLPIKDGLEPSFEQIVKVWKERNEMR